MRREIWAAAALSLLSVPAWGGNAVEDWARIEALERTSPGGRSSPEAARAAVVARLNEQEKALRDFIAGYPEDPRADDARLRLAHLLAGRADLDGKSAADAESAAILEAMEKGPATTASRRADAAFARIVIAMRRSRNASVIDRDSLLRSAQEFQARHSSDNRAGALLAEVGGLFDDAPKRKFDILQDALRSATDQELRMRIDDDIRRIGMIGRPVPLEFTATNGRKIDVAALRGKVVVIYFFAGWSAPAIHELERVAPILAKFPRTKVEPIGISLDRNRAGLESVIKSRRLDWAVYFDGKGWESPLVRSLGINALPTTWVLDARGNLRTLNARAELEETVRALMREH